MTFRRALVSLFLAAALVTPVLRAGEVASANLNIIGMSLDVPDSVSTGADISAVIQTTFGGKTNGDVPETGLTVIGELTGAGLDAPITVTARPGGRITLPPLHEQGDYAVQNIRLVDGNGNFVQYANRTTTVVHVVGVLGTQVTITQLTPDDLRARGISIDSRNYDVYDYNFIFAINGQTVTIPYPVVIDRRTHEPIKPPSDAGFTLPEPKPDGPPPRFQPPSVGSFMLDDDLSGDTSPDQESPDPPNKPKRRPSIPAAVIIPTNFGVLHQFFAVVLNVSNNADAASQIRLDSVTATIQTDSGMRVVKVNPAVTIGTPVPIYDAKTGARYLVALAQGTADWSVESLRAGTHPIDIDVRATYQAPNQADVSLHGHVSSTIVVSDPRFQINFVHPSNVRAQEPYTAYAFITNTSPQVQNVKLSLASLPPCGSGFNFHLCRTEGGSGESDLTFQPGQTIPVPYKLTPDITGHFYAAAADAPEGITASISLVMQVQPGDIPLSPATLIMPYYTKFVSSDLVDAYMPLLGIGFSLATAPVSAQISKYPRLIADDVYTRAQDIARAGERIFVARHALATDNPDEDREPVVHLALDLLGNVERRDRATNTPDMREWDQVRMLSADGRKGGAAVARELERTGLANGRTMTAFVDGFAAATSHRTPYFLALAHGAPVGGVDRPYAMTVSGATTHTTMSGQAELADPVRTLAYGELTRFSSPSESGELALVGRWNESLVLSITAASPAFTLDLIYPGTNDGTFIRNSIALSGAVPGTAVTLTVDRGNHALNVTGAVPAPIVSDVSQTPLTAVGAAQDMYLDKGGHVVTLLFNRPVTVADQLALRNLFALTTSVPSANFQVTKKNKPSDPAAPTVIPGASLQSDGRMLNISFDHALSTHANYSLAIDPIADAAVPGSTYSTTSLVPRIDNDAPGGVVVGKLLLGDGSGVPNAQIECFSGDTTQWDTTLTDGSFLFEFIPRDIDNNLRGNYSVLTTVDGKQADLDGVIRTNGEVQRIVLQFLGRGSAKGHVSYSDGTPIANAPVTVGSRVYERDDFHRGFTDASGNYAISDLPVGTLTFAVADPKGNVAYATNEIRTPGQQLTQDLVIQKRDSAGLATVRVTVKRSDTNVVVPGAHVGVYTQGYSLIDGYTDVNGQFEFRSVPAGLVSILAAEFSITNESVGVEFDVKPDTVFQQTLILHVPTPAEQAGSATVEGDVKRDDPTSPGDRTKDVLVPNAVVQIGGMSPVTADANGHYVFLNVPLAKAGKGMSAFDPATGRHGVFILPGTLIAGQSNTFPVLLQTTTPQGWSKVRVRLFSSTGELVRNYKVIDPGFPANVLTPAGDGTYSLYSNRLRVDGSVEEIEGVKVPFRAELWAIPNGVDAKYGYQTAHGPISADFDGQDPLIELRLPGQGTSSVRILVQKRCNDGDPTCTATYDPAPGLVAVSHMMWSEADQSVTFQERPPVSTDPVTGAAAITQIPVGSFSVATVDHPAGYDIQSSYIAFEGDAKPVDLRLASLGSVSGRVVNYDGQTPVGGASLTFSGSTVIVDGITTKADGSFLIPSMARGQSFRITADATVDGIYRTGYVDGQTPAAGGPVNGLVIVMRQQANISGRIVDSTGAPLGQARYWARELSWPYRSFGSQQNPLLSGNDGRFVLNNLFAGGVRITAESPTFQELHGDAQVEIANEGDNHSNVVITVAAGAGTSSITVSVVDSSNAYAKVPNAEVTLVNERGAYDFGSTDPNGVIVFDELPAGQTYGVRATSKVVGRSGSIDGIALVQNVPASAQVALTLTGRVSGTVYDADTAPELVVKGIPVYLYTSTAMFRATTDDTGAFVFNGIPEGSFRLEAVDINSARKANNTLPLSIDKLFPDRDGIHLDLEKTATLNVSVYLPDDQGHSSGVFAPLADVKVTGTNYSREQQEAGAPAVFPKLLTNHGFHVDVHELGGEERSLSSDGFIPSGSYANSVSLVFATTGTLQVQVTADDPTLVPNAFVTIVGPRSTTYYTNASGYQQLDSLPLGDYSVYVSSQNLTAVASGHLGSHTQPLALTLKLGSRAAIDGYVDAELGGVSVGTRVVADVTSSASQPLHLETHTDANGHYLFQGLPVASTHLNLTFYGPDDVTIGAALVNQTIADGTLGTVHMDRVKLDATPPTIVALFPENNANSVSPTEQLRITFSEPISASSVTPGNFQLIATDDATQVQVAVEQDIVNGSPVVIVTPSTRLKSNVIYRYIVSSGITDVSGHHLKADVSATFTTVDYTEPRITGISPSTALPIDKGVSFRLKFNKPIDLTSYTAPNGGVAKLERLDAPGGNVIAAVPTTLNLDLVDPSTLIIAPIGVEIAPASFYRVTVSGTKDTRTPPNVQTAAQVFEYASIDNIAPVATILSPLPAGTPLIAGSSYVIKVSIVDEGTTTPSKDVQYVDWFTTDGTTDTAVLRTRVAPDYSYLLVVPKNVTSYTLKASATDLSFHNGPLATYTWTVTPNQPPANVVLTTSTASAYLTNRVDAGVTFEDEGTVATVALAVTGQHADGSPYPLTDDAFSPKPSWQVTRPNTSAPWSPSPASFGVTLPADLKEGTTLHFVASVTDSLQQTTQKSVDVNLLTDTTPPVIVSMDPKAESSYKYVTGAANTFPIVIKVKDAESGVARVHLNYNGNDFDVTSRSYDASTATWTYTATGQVVAKNADTRVHITATAYDYHGNATPQTVDVIYQAVNDGTLPVAQWITPVDTAALPAATTLPVTLRVRATDDVHVDSVTFTGSALASPLVLTAPTGGNVYEQVVSITTPAAGTPLTFTATVKDSDPGHDVVLPISVDVVPFDVNNGDAMLVGDASLEGADVARYANHTIVVSGNGTDVYIKAPLTLKNLIVVNGGHVGNPDRVKLDLTVTDHLFVDATSSIDVSSKGYLGAWQHSEDGTLTNSSASGMTLGGTSANGALSSHASYAGIGAHGALTPTNATYGSITDPSDFGSGGGGSAACCIIGANGGGAFALHASAANVALAGVIRADGGHGLCGSPCTWGAASGGSISLTAKSLVTGYAARITANGGDDNAFADTSSGAGGGRVAVRVSDRLDLDPALPVIQARGGRDGAGEEGTNYVDGGAGTVFLARPGSTNGQLIVSSYDERYPSTVHRTLGTPLSGALTFDSITIGPRALARFDSSYTVPQGAFSADPTALVLLPADQPQFTSVTTVPAAGGSLPQNGKLAVTYSINAPDGTGFVRLPLTAASSETIDDSGTYPVTIAGKLTNLTVASNAPTGDATLQLHAETRSGRTVDSTVLTYTIVPDTPAVIDQFDVNPASTYANHIVTVTAAATDDQQVTALNLTASNGATVTPSTFTAGTHVVRGFTVAIPPATAGGTDIQLTLSASDAFPGRAATTQVKSVTVLNDTAGPAASFAQPAAPYQVNDGASPTLAIDVVADDAEVGVQKVTATFDGVTYDLVQTTGTNHWTKTIPVAHVFGSDPVQRILTAKAYDYAGNTGSAGPLTISVIPSVDPNGPVMAWTCASPGALYPAGSSVVLKVFALSPSGADAQVQFQIDGGALVNATADGTLPHTWDTTLAVAANEAPGTQHTVLAFGTATGGHTSSLITTVTVIGGTRINAGITINESDTSNDGGSFYIVSGGSLTIAGAHHFASIAVLEGGTLVQKQTDLQNPKALTIDNLYVACTGVLNADSLGYAKSATYPGAGTPGNSEGGGHMGRGGIWDPGLVGGTFGSVYHPLEAGGGGQVGDVNYANGAGGGIVRVVATSVTVDGTVRANAQEAPPVATWGSGAGGSVYITTSKLAGNGALQANGATWSGASPQNRGAGGGGAVAVEYGSVSGNIVNNLTALGGAGDQAVIQAAAGTAFAKSSAAPYGDLVVNNGTRSNSMPSFVYTDLPAFGLSKAVSVPSAGVAVTDASWIGPFFIGHPVRVTAPDGTIRGTWHVTAVANDASVRTLNGVVTLPLQATAYDGYLMYSDTGYSTASTNSHIVAVRNNSGVWQYDTGSAFTSFTPAAGDKLFASFSKNANVVTTMQPFTCGATCPQVAGLSSLALVRGEVLMNATRQLLFGTYPLDQPIASNNSFFLGRDADKAGLTFSAGTATVTLESGASVQPGDRLRGVYQFDHVTVKNARVYSRDLVESANAPSVDGQSTFVPGNAAAPAIDMTKISFGIGTNGPVVSGAAGAVSDANAPIDLFVRNTNRAGQSGAFTTDYNNIAFGTKGGFSVHKLVGGGLGNAQTAAIVTGYAYLQARPSTTNRKLDLAIGEFDFGFNADGTVGVWVNGWRTSFPAYNPSMLFRIEKTPTTITFYVDGQVFYQTSCDSTPRVMIAQAWDDNGELNSIEYGIDTPARFSSVANANGSFTVPVYGAAGDAFTLVARDRHTYPLSTDETSIGTLPADLGLNAPTFSVNSVIGSHPVTGTVMLRRAAAAGGATVSLSSSSTAATVPSFVTVPAGQTSATFNITTAVVAASTPATITASWGGSSASAVLTVTPDNVPPSITITAPASGAVLIEGTTVQVKATVTDADSGVKSVTAAIDGQQVALTLSAGVYSGNLVMPDVSGSTPVARQIIVTAADNANNPGSAQQDILVQPIVDSAPPLLTLTCPSGAAMLPAGYPAKFRVFAKSSPISPASNKISTVQFTVTGSGVNASITASASPGLTDYYEGVYTIPALADGTVLTVTATATTLGGGVSTQSFPLTVVVPEVAAITTSKTIAAGDTTYDGKTLVLYGTSASPIDVQVQGTHPFSRVLVLDYGTLSHPSTPNGSISTALTFQSSSVYVSCDGSIDTTGRGYAANVTYPVGATTPAFANGGSHLGYGGFNQTPLASTFGSVYQPMEAGGGASRCCPGGGVVSINATSFMVDGAVRSNGANGPGAEGGGGGSVYLRVTSISGSGVVEARGGSGDRNGGGGAIAVEYTNAAGTLLNNMSASCGQQNSAFGGSGTIFIKGPNAQYGDLTLNDNGHSGQRTELPSFGAGTAAVNSSGATLITGRTTDIPAYFVGHWIEITDANGVPKGAWRVQSIPSPRTVILAPNAGETISIVSGDKWQGVYHFDSLSAPDGELLVSGDPIRLGGNGVLNISGPSTAGQFLEMATPVNVDRVNVTGNVSLTGITSRLLTVKAGATLTHPVGASLTVNVSDTMTAEAGATIDVSGRGFAANTTYSGAGGPGFANGGSHLGYGGFNQTPLATTFGSVYQPMEAGGGASRCCPGGGIVTISATTLQHDGVILANGTNGPGAEGGAGGSIWIRATTLNGNGSVEVKGGSGDRNGGGGAIAVEYASSSGAVLNNLRAWTGEQNNSAFGGSGTIFLKTPAMQYGKLIVNNNGHSGQATELPSLGAGSALGTSAGATLVTDRNTDIPAYFVGHWVEITDGAGVSKGAWRVQSIPSPRTLVLAPNGGETITVAGGDKWQGVYHFDTVTAMNGEKLNSIDPIRLGGNGVLNISGPAAAGQYTEVSTPVVADQVTIVSGNVSLSAITARLVTVKSGATLSHPTGASLVINASDTMTVESGATLDVSGRGFGANTTYPGAGGPGFANGGSHLGYGGLNQNPLATTFGSVYRPMEPGGGASRCCSGGGVVYINAATVQHDGAIFANGTNGPGAEGGAGGSVWIHTATLAGNGSIEAKGGSGDRNGGGGAIAVEYATFSGGTLLNNFRAWTGEQNNGAFGGPGTIFVKGPSTQYGSLTINNNGHGGQVTELPSLGKGTAQTNSSGATLFTDRNTDIPAYFIGHWVEITDAGGSSKGAWRIQSIPSPRTVVLAPNAGETISIVAGDTWQGVYHFDSVLAVNGERLVTVDPIRLGGNGVLNISGPTAPGQFTEVTANVTVDQATIVSGNVALTGINARILTVKSGATLSHVNGASLAINVSESVTVEANAAIDVSGRGFSANTTYPGAGGPAFADGGSHLGFGGLNQPPLGTTFGSVYQPMESGGGASRCCPGGGVVTIQGPTVTNNGVIRANGTNGPGAEGGAGGSVWIRTTALNGSGSVEANGGSGDRNGGGGAIAIEYASLTGTMLNNLKASTGEQGTGAFGGPGTIFVKGPGAVFGTVTADNNTHSGQATQLPGFGAGTALATSSGALLATDRTVDIPSYFIGHWIEVTDSNGVVRGTWRVQSIPSPRSVILAPNGAETIPVQPGDGWRGVYRFDGITVKSATMQSPDRIDSTGALDSFTSTHLIYNAARPQFAAAKVALIQIAPTTSGNANLVAQPGTVGDTDGSIKIAVTNTRTGVHFNVNANGDGSFTVAVTGQTGDVFAIVATDSHSLFPLSSLTVSVTWTQSGSAIPSAPSTSATSPAAATALTSVTLPESVNGGANAAGVVTLNGVAAVDITVQLRSSAPSLSVPATVTVPAGQSSAAFELTTTAPAADVVVAVTATFNGSEQTATTIVTTSAARGGGTSSPLFLLNDDSPGNTIYADAETFLDALRLPQ